MDLSKFNYSVTSATLGKFKEDGAFCDVTKHLVDVESDAFMEIMDSQ